MTSRSRLLAMLSPNPAFAAIVCRVLEDDIGNAVPNFASLAALTAFLRITPVDVVVLDCDQFEVPAVDVAHGLKTGARPAHPAPRIVALTRSETTHHPALLAAGIDAVLRKPIVPSQLVGCIGSLLAADSTLPVTPRRRAADHLPRPRSAELHAAPLRRIGNVIPLFGEGRVAH